MAQRYGAVWRASQLADGMQGIKTASYDQSRRNGAEATSHSAMAIKGVPTIEILHMFRPVISFPPGRTSTDCATVHTVLVVIMKGDVSMHFRRRHTHNSERYGAYPCNWHVGIVTCSRL